MGFGDRAVSRSRDGKRLPEMKHYGDVHGLKGGDLGAVDVITFGSPC